MGVTLCRDSAEPLLEVCDVSEVGEAGGLAIAALWGQSSATGQALSCARPCMQNRPVRSAAVGLQICRCVQACARRVLWPLQHPRTSP